MATSLAVSTGAVDITPDIGYPMGGYGVDTPRVSTGVNEPLMARCTILWDSGTPKVIVTADVLAFGRTLHQEIRARIIALGVASPNFVLTATHTHNGPVLVETLDPLITYNLLDLADVDAYSDALVADIQVLVHDTLAAARTTCTLDYVVADENFSYNREGLPYNEVDVPVLVARSLSGIPRAVLFGYGAHPVAASGQTLFDPDYPAEAIKQIEATAVGVFAQFLLGPAGDQNPVVIGDFGTANGWGADLGATVANAITNPDRSLTGPIQTSYQELTLPLDITDSVANLALVRNAYAVRAARPGVPGFERRHANLMIGEIDAHSFATSVPLPLQIWRFGGTPGLRVVFCGGEVVSGYAVALRALCGGASQLWFNGYSNEIPCYIPTNDLLDHPCYAGGLDMDSPGIAGGSMTIYHHLGHFRRTQPGVLSSAGVEETLLSQLEALL
jgi:neutral ceramidase